MDDLKASCLRLNTETLIVYVSVLKEFVVSSVDLTVLSYLSLASVSARGHVFVQRAGQQPCGTASLIRCCPLPLDALPPSRGSSLAAALCTTAW